MASIMKLIGVINRCAKLYRSDKLRDTGLSGSHHIYIMSICAAPGMSQDALARMIYADKSSAARHLASLERNGFVERVQDESDKRAVKIYPTEKAMNILPEIKKILADWCEYITAGMPPEDIERFGHFLSSAALRASEYVKNKTSCPRGGE